MPDLPCLPTSRQIEPRCLSLDYGRSVPPSLCSRCTPSPSSPPSSCFSCYVVTQPRRDTSSASLSYAAGFLSTPFAHECSPFKVVVVGCYRCNARIKRIFRTERNFHERENEISSGRFIIAVRTRKKKEVYPVLFGERLNPATQKERQTTTEAKRDARTSFRTGYRFRHGGTTLGNDERPCVPLEDKSSLVHPRYSSAVIYFDSVLLLFII